MPIGDAQLARSAGQVACLLDRREQREERRQELRRPFVGVKQPLRLDRDLQHGRSSGYVLACIRSRRRPSYCCGTCADVTVAGASTPIAVVAKLAKNNSEAVHGVEEALWRKR